MQTPTSPLSSPFLPTVYGPRTSWVPVFLEFLSKITIISKEEAVPGPITPYEAQYRFIGELCKGLDNDVRHFVLLKARQLGASTIMLALDIFWLYMHPGLQGALVTDDGDNLIIMRQTITQMLESLPPSFRVPIKSHNRTALVLLNGPKDARGRATIGSRLQYMIAGTRKNAQSGLGISRAINFVHATECSRWGNQSALETFIRALAQKHPHRLYIFESTARGFNVFYDMCKEAKESPSQHFAFIGWWAKEIYRLDKNSKEYAYWWGRHPHMTDDEAKKCAIVKEKYGHEINSEQIAYYRQESYNKSAGTMSSEMPWHEMEAFVATGSSYFSLQRVTDDMTVIHDAGVKMGFAGYRYELGKVFTDTRIKKVERVEDAQLRIWEEPKKGARYVIGVDVAEGKSQNADNSVISVWRCFADKVIQVAEFATSEPETRQVAWVLAHLAGCYRECIINVEINGPGALLMLEMRHLKQQMKYGELRKTAQDMQILNALDNARWFLYSRLESVGGASYVYNTRVTTKEKPLLCGLFRDTYNTEQALIRSVQLLSEMTTLIQDGDKIEASGRNKDDRVIAGALAVSAWANWVRQAMIVNQQTWAREMAREQQLAPEAPGQQVVNHIVANHFKRKEAERTQDHLRRIIDGF